MTHAGHHELAIEVARRGLAHHVPRALVIVDRVVGRDQRIGPAVIADQFSPARSERAQIRIERVDDFADGLQLVRVRVEVEARHAKRCTGLFIGCEVLQEAARIVLDADRGPVADVDRRGREHVGVAGAELGAEDLTISDAAMLVDGTPDDRFVRGNLRRAEAGAVFLRIERTRARILDDAERHAVCALAALRDESCADRVCLS